MPASLTFTLPNYSSTLVYTNFSLSGIGVTVFVFVVYRHGTAVTVQYNKYVWLSEWREKKSTRGSLLTGIQGVKTVCQYF